MVKMAVADSNTMMNFLVVVRIAIAT